MWAYITSLAATALALLELAKDWREHKTNLRRVAVLGLIVVVGIAGALATYFTDKTAEKRHNEDEERISKLQATLDAQSAKLDKIVLLLQAQVEQPTPSSPLAVRLSWQSSAPSKTPAENAIGYHVYRSFRPHDVHMIRLNAAPITTTSYVDENVKPGNTYYYVVTGVNARGQESARSGEIAKSVPE